MIETDLAHLRFLHQRCERGDRLYSDDIIFLVELDAQLKKGRDMIEVIREHLEND